MRLTLPDDAIEAKRNQRLLAVFTHRKQKREVHCSRQHRRLRPLHQGASLAGRHTEQTNKYISAALSHQLADRWLIALSVIDKQRLKFSVSRSAISRQPSTVSAEPSNDNLSANNLLSS